MAELNNAVSTDDLDVLGAPTVSDYVLIARNGEIVRTLVGDLPDGSGSGITTTFETRADFVSWVAGGGTASNGTFAFAAGCMYVADSSETALSGLTGWKPAGQLYFQHFGDNTTPGTTDMSAVVLAALTYANDLSSRYTGPDGMVTIRSANDDPIAISETIDMNGFSGVHVTGFNFVSIGSWSAGGPMFSVQKNGSAKAERIVFTYGHFEGAHICDGFALFDDTEHQCAVRYCTGHGPTEYGVRATTKNAAFAVEDCRFNQYEWGETGWDVYANRTAILIDVQSTDSRVVRNTAFYCGLPMRCTGYLMQVMDNHPFNDGVASGAPSQGMPCAEFDINAGVVSGNYFDNGYVEWNCGRGATFSAGAISITGNIFFKNANGDNDAHIRFTAPDGRTGLDLSDLIIANNAFRSENTTVTTECDFVTEGSGSFAATTIPTTFGNLREDGNGYARGIPPLQLGSFMALYASGLFSIQSFFADGDGASITQSKKLFFPHEGGTSEATIQAYYDAGNDRRELKLTAQGDDYSTGSNGSGLRLYGNDDPEHPGSFAILVGSDGAGDARLIMTQDGKTYIGGDAGLWGYSDAGNGRAHLNIKDRFTGTDENLPGMLFHYDARSTGNVDTTPQRTQIWLVEEEGSDLGAGEGLCISYEFKLQGDASPTEIGQVGFRKSNSTDTNRENDFYVQLSEDGSTAPRDVFWIEGDTGRIHSIGGLDLEGSDVGTDAIVAKATDTGRDYLRLYSSGDASGSGSGGAGITLYGNDDSTRAGGAVILTGADDNGDARLGVTIDGKIYIGGDVFTDMDADLADAYLNIVDSVSGTAEGRPGIHMIYDMRSSGGSATTAQDAMIWQVNEETQDLGAGDGLGITHKVKLSGDGSAVEVGQLAFEKSNDTDTDRTTDFVVRLSEDGSTAPRDVMKIDGASGAAEFPFGVIPPGPYADDTAAAAGGVPLNAIYRVTGGTVAWRQT